MSQSEMSRPEMRRSVSSRLSIKRGMPNRKTQGFTLLEVLMALVLLALLLSLAWASMRAAIQSSRAGEALIARTEQSRTVQTFLRRQLTQAMPIAYEQIADQGRERRFEGSADEMVFVAPMPGYLSRGGAHVQTLRFVGGGRGQRLEFNFAQLNGYDADNPEFGDEPVVLLEGISRGRFEFRELDENGELREWSSDWETSERLPLMVRMVLEFDRNDPRRWPAFDVTVMAAAAGIQPIGFNQRQQRGLTIPNSGARTPRPAGRP